MNVAPRYCIAFVLSLALTSGPAPIHASQSGAPDGSAVLSVITVAALDDGGYSVLGRPMTLSEDTRGRFVIADFSDGDIKVYSSQGKRIDTMGRAGQGPGEFQALVSGAVLGDWILGYDFVSSSLTYFALDGSVSKTLRLPRPSPWKVRVADADTLVLVASPKYRGNLLRVAGNDGRVTAEFFPLDERWTRPTEMLSQIWFLSDALDGLIFAGMWGGAQISVFDYDGDLLSRGPVDPKHGLRSLHELVEANGGRVKQRDGTPVRHLERALVQIVALPDSMVVVQIAHPDAVIGGDLLEGGTLLVLKYAEGRVQEVARVEENWGLMGRDAGGRALLMRYHPEDADRYEIGRIVISR